MKLALGRAIPRLAVSHGSAPKPKRFTAFNPWDAGSPVCGKPIEQIAENANCSGGGSTVAENAKVQGHPRSDWQYPIIERALPMDCGMSLGLSVIDSRGIRSVIRFKLTDEFNMERVR